MLCPRVPGVTLRWRSSTPGVRDVAAWPGDESGCRTDESDRDDPDAPELCAPERDRSPCPPEPTSLPATCPPSNDCGAGICWPGWGAASSRPPPLTPVVVDAS